MSSPSNEADPLSRPGKPSPAYPGCDGVEFLQDLKIDLPPQETHELSLWSKMRHTTPKVVFRAVAELHGFNLVFKLKYANHESAPTTPIRGDWQKYEGDYVPPFAGVANWKWYSRWTRPGLRLSVAVIGICPRFVQYDATAPRQRIVECPSVCPFFDGRDVPTRHPVITVGESTVFRTNRTICNINGNKQHLKLSVSYFYQPQKTVRESNQWFKLLNSWQWAIGFCTPWWSHIMNWTIVSIFQEKRFEKWKPDLHAPMQRCHQRYAGFAMRF